MEHPAWAMIARLRKTNRAIYGAVEELVGRPEDVEDPTLALMQRFYARHPVLARAVHRQILNADDLIWKHSQELACE